MSRNVVAGAEFDVRRAPLPPPSSSACVCASSHPLSSVTRSLRFCLPHELPSIVLIGVSCVVACRLMVCPPPPHRPLLPGQGVCQAVMSAEMGPRLSASSQGTFISHVHASRRVCAQIGTVSAASYPCFPLVSGGRASMYTASVFHLFVGCGELLIFFGRCARP